MELKSLLSRWRSDPAIGQNIVSWQVQPSRAADLKPYPTTVDPILQRLLAQSGYPTLYSHQAEAVDLAQQGANFAVVTNTASGKTLCYNLPVLNALIIQPSAHALYLFPTKALTQDQLTNLRNLTASLEKPLSANIYDGDTPQQSRQLIRKTSRIIMTNPDMLHTGILPHHTVWKEFLSNLRFIVIDEMHSYRGVFGSHVANVIRRLKRIARFYGSQPQSILTSATIANPQELAEKLIEQPIKLIDHDGAPSGQRNFLIYNPPLIDEQLGLRKSSLIEGASLASQLIRADFQTIIFGRARRTIELILTYLREQHTNLPPKALRGYRSGYLRQERRDIEEGLRRGIVRAVAATSALELGIDIGDLEAAVIIGYPGSIAAIRQQAGRAGRKNNTSLAVLVTAANAMDQYLANHPEYFFERSPEQALIEPNNLPILLQHIRCAAFELPFTSADSFGSIDSATLSAFLELLSNSGDLHAQNDRYFWVADEYPAGSISLRSATPDNVSLVVQDFPDSLPQTIGQVDRNSAYWMVHPEAIYIHEAQPYYVKDLDLETGVAHLTLASLDYFTEPRRKTSIEEHHVFKSNPVNGGTKHFGDLQVVDQVIGFRKVRWFTHEQLGGGEVNLPPTHLQTVGYWLSISQAVVDRLRDEMLWNADANDYGPHWAKLRSQVLDRDEHKCKACGVASQIQPLHVHHLQPFRSFTTIDAANALSNLVSLCPTCHKLAEQAIRIRSGLAGMSYVVGNLAPLILMCDSEDIGVLSDPQSILGEGQPTMAIYDNIPGGIGLSERLFDEHKQLILQGYETVSKCPCQDGCPSCVGPIGEEGYGGKKEALALLKAFL